MTLLPSRMLADLKEQHAAIRVLMQRCEQVSGPALSDAVDDLRLALDAHNRFEERLLLPVLRELDAFGDVRIEEMLHDHVNEHLALNQDLTTESPEAVVEALEKLSAHLAAEERYFVTSRVLRDDLVSLEGAG